MNWYLQVLKKYAVFSGRASRTEFWMFVLFNILIALVLYIPPIAVGVLGAMGGGNQGPGIMGILSILPLIIYGLGTLIPGLAVAIRRLHDTNRSGWWILLSFVPCVSLVLIVFYALPSTSGSNNFGAEPK